MNVATDIDSTMGDDQYHVKTIKKKPPERWFWRLLGKVS
jgi:hypothetical protein